MKPDLSFCAPPKTAAEKPAVGKLLRLKDVIAPRGPLPISKSTFYAGISTGIYPKPLKLGARTSVWRSEDIEAIVKNPPGALPKTGAGVPT